MDIESNKDFLVKMAHTKMPFGKYKGYFLIDIPEYYYSWFSQKGFPQGTLGQMMEQMYDIKINGLESIIKNIQRQFPKE